MISTPLPLSPKTKSTSSSGKPVTRSVAPGSVRVQELYPHHVVREVHHSVIIHD